ncbi:hypothetical protein [Flavobacterium ginsengiterrae]|uniref:Lipoprotein n=1 Tax=Flavobacterium ginsengiterrae TaxID=871695 RepID=A0ABP7H460_9FLAO
MRTVFKSKMMFVLIIAGLLGSCKNNQDGYSDEIETSKTPIDSANVTADTTQTMDNSTAGAGSVQNNAPEGNNSTTGSKTGTGSGPGESKNDGSTYSGSSGLQKDSTASKTKETKDKIRK